MSRLFFRLFGIVALALGAPPPGLAVQRQTEWVASVPGVYSFQYLLYLPPGYDATTPAKWPLMIFLHGSGQSGTNLELVAASGPTKEIEHGRDFPCVVIAPQNATMTWWNAATLEPFIQDMIAWYHIEPDRVYVTGLSLGGFGTWDLAVRHPERYAAVAPLCGGGDASQAYKLRDTQVWAFHGALDTSVPATRTQEMINAIRQAGGNPLVSIFPDLGHDVWTVTYANTGFYDWMFEQSLAVAPPAIAPGNVIPTRVTAPATPVPSTPTTSAPAEIARVSSGGGGGALDAWFVAELFVLELVRRWRKAQQSAHGPGAAAG